MSSIKLETPKSNLINLALVNNIPINLTLYTVKEELNIPIDKFYKKK